MEDTSEFYNEEDTSGFYKNDDGNLLFAPNFVYAPTFALERELSKIYTYPVEGWYWFNTEYEANAHFGIIIDIVTDAG